MTGIIAAVTINGVIGVENKLPFDYPEDMKHFRTTTANSVVIMGRKTFEGIGRPLPKRRNVVISSKKLDNPGIEVFSSVEEAMRVVDVAPAVAHFDEQGNQIDMSQPIWFIGGASIYEEGMKFADKIVLTLTPDIELRTPAVKFPWINPQKFSLKTITPLSLEKKLYVAEYEKITSTTDIHTS